MQSFRQRTVYYEFVLKPVIMEQRIFYIVIHCRGHHRNGIAIYNASHVNLQEDALFKEAKIFFEHCRKIKLYHND
jgi:hypothetical protein